MTTTNTTTFPPTPLRRALSPSRCFPIEMETFPNCRFKVSDEGYYLMQFLNRRGEDHKSIAKKLRCHPKTVQKWLKCATPPSVKPPRTFLRRNKIKPLSPRWPARSPDLSPIETVWAWLKYKVAARAPYGVEELAQFIRESWEAIPQKSIDALVRGFKQRCKQCVKGKGNVVKLSAAGHGGKKKV